MKSYQKIHALGKKEVIGILDGYIDVEEKIDGCVDINARILMSDLTYKPAGLLQIGDKIISIEDTVNNPRLVETTVKNNIPIKKQCYEIITTTRKIIASIDHPFLLSKRYNQSNNTHNFKQWVTVKELHIGDKITSLPVWNSKNDWKSGYIAGQFDGEGSLVRNGNGRVLSYYQKIGKELDLVEKILKEDGFVFSIDTRKRKPHHKMVGSIIFRSDWMQILKVLGTYRPQRLLNIVKEKVWNLSPLNNSGLEEIIEINNIGKRIVAGLTTESHTYIAEGLISHNSQFRIEIKNLDNSISIQCGSHHQELSNVDSLFKKATDIVLQQFRDLQLSSDVKEMTIFGEYLAKPKHNKIPYARTPTNHIMIFDVLMNDSNGEHYLDREEKARFAFSWGFEVVPTLWHGFGVNFNEDIYNKLLETPSILGHQAGFDRVEGIVIKNYAKKFSVDETHSLFGHFMSAKIVNEEFKEIKKTKNPDNMQLEEFKESLRTIPRWEKAVQVLNEAGELKNESSDIGLIIRRVMTDIKEEEQETIKQKLFDMYIKEILQHSVNGLATWYQTEKMK